jgi:hypothetical protein
MRRIVEAKSTETRRKGGAQRETKTRHFEVLYAATNDDALFAARIVMRVVCGHGTIDTRIRNRYRGAVDATLRCC